LDNLLRRLIICIQIKFKRLSIQHPYILRNHLLQIPQQVFQLIIIFIVIIRNNWYSIVKLIGERINSIVNNNDVLKISSLQNPEIFYKYSLFCLDAVISEEAVVDVFVLWVEVVKDNVGVAAMRSRKYDNLKVLAQVFQNRLCIWPYIYPSLFQIKITKSFNIHSLYPQTEK
jgi:hypothetical protein